MSSGVSGVTQLVNAGLFESCFRFRCMESAYRIFLFFNYYYFVDLVHRFCSQLSHRLVV